MLRGGCGKIRCHHDLWRNDIESHETAPAGHDDTKALEWGFRFILAIGRSQTQLSVIGHFRIEGLTNDKLPYAVK